MGVAVGAKIGEAEIGIVVEETVAEQIKATWFVWGEVVTTYPIDAGPEFVVGVVVGLRVVSVANESGDFVDGLAEDEDIFFANLLENFDIGPVESSDGQGTVEGEFHIARATGFFSSGGDLFGEIGGGDDSLGEADAIVWEKDNLEFVVDAGIGVDHGGDGIDRFDDTLCEVVAGSGFGGEDEDAWGDIEMGRLEKASIEGENVEEIEVLPFVFVEPLNLDIEEGGRVDGDVAVLLDQAGEADFVGMFDGHELLLKLGVIGKGFEVAELIEVPFPAVADRAGDQVTEEGIASEKPASRGDAIGFVIKLSWVEGVEIGEEITLDQLGVNGRYAIDGKATDDAKIGHANILDVAFFDDRHGSFF